MSALIPGRAGLGLVEVSVEGDLSTGRRLSTQASGRRAALPPDERLDATLFQQRTCSVSAVRCRARTDDDPLSARYGLVPAVELVWLDLPALCTF